MAFQWGRCYIKSCFGPLLFQFHQRSLVFKCVFICVNLWSVISSLPPLSKLLWTLWPSEMEASKVFFSHVELFTLRECEHDSEPVDHQALMAHQTNSDLFFPSLKWPRDIFNIVSLLLSYQIGMLITARRSHANSIFAHYFPSKLNSLRHIVRFSI